MDMRIPPLTFKIMLESNPLNSIMLVGGLAVVGRPVHVYGAACANLSRTFHELQLANFSNAAMDGTASLHTTTIRISLLRFDSNFPRNSLWAWESQP